MIRKPYEIHETLSRKKLTIIWYSIVLLYHVIVNFCVAQSFMDFGDVLLSSKFHIHGV